MFSFTFYQAPKTRFEKSIEFQSIQPLISALFSREEILKTEIDYNHKESLDYRKYTIVSMVCNKIRQLLDAFNQDNKNNAISHSDRVKTFLNALTDLIASTISHYHKTLGAHRHAKSRHLARNVIDLSLNTTITAAGIVSPPPIAIAVLLGQITGATNYVTTPVKNSFFYVAGLSKTTKPKTLEILLELKEVLEQLNENIALEQSISNSTSTQEIKTPNAFICPISGALMKDPVIFMLDRHTYDRLSITQWLMQKRTSPMTREKLDETQDINATLIPNIALHEAIEEYKKNPMILEENYQPPKPSM